MSILNTSIVNGDIDRRTISVGGDKMLGEQILEMMGGIPLSKA